MQTWSSSSIAADTLS